MKSQRTIGGISLNEVFKELRREFPTEKIKQHDSTKMLYVSSRDIEERLNQVIGIENWDFVLLSEPRIYRLGKNGYESCVVSGKLIIYDDDRVPIVRSTGGGADIIYPSGTNRPMSVPNAVDSAASDVFKRCAKKFGIAIISNKKIKGEAKKLTANLSNTTTKSQDEVGDRNVGRKFVAMSVKVLEPFKEIGKGGARVTVSYKGEEIELIIWKDEWDKLRKCHADSFKIGNKLNNINFDGFEQEYNGKKQLVFCGLINGAA